MESQCGLQVPSKMTGRRVSSDAYDLTIVFINLPFPTSSCKSSIALARLESLLFSSKIKFPHGPKAALCD